MRVWSLTAVGAILFVVAGCVFTFNRQMQKRNNPMIQTAILAHRQLERSETLLDISSDSPEVVSSWFADALTDYQTVSCGLDDLSRNGRKLFQSTLLSGRDRDAP